MRWAIEAERSEIIEQVARSSGFVDLAALVPATPESQQDGCIPLPVFVLVRPDDMVSLCGARANHAREKMGTVPVAILTRADLEDASVWLTMLSLYPVSLVDLARWWKRNLPDLSPRSIMMACGLADHHRSLADWKEMADLDESSAMMHRTHDLPLNVLRLWNRLDPAQRETWLHIFQTRRIKRNLIREIIIDFYDLESGQRESVLSDSLAFADNWSSPSVPFPAQQLRDRVHRQRYSKLESMRQEILLLKRELNLPPQVQIEIPADLESSGVRIIADLKSDKTVDDLVAFLQNEKNRNLLRRISDRL